MTFRPTATIHLNHIADNWLALDAALPETKIGAVVKANAYGLGLAPVAETLHDTGCDVFFVAYPFEGEALRRAIGPHALIFVLNGPTLDEGDLYEDADLHAVINTPSQYRDWYSWLASGQRIPYALHFDTGMNRLGLDPADAEELASAVEAIPPALIMSHLACAEDSHNPKNAQQKARLEKLTDAFRGIPFSLANSGGVSLGRDYGFALARPGIALYGGGEDVEALELKHAVTVSAPIINVIHARAGESVGYGATVTLKEDTLIATCAIGYADGILRSGSNKIVTYLGDTPCPVMGRISMDLVTIDVSKAHQHAKSGAWVEFVGQNAKLEEQAARCGTIGYELLTGLGHRVERIYEK